jgi:hypothetical protein
MTEQISQPCPKPSPPWKLTGTAKGKSSIIDIISLSPLPPYKEEEYDFQKV